MISTHVIAVTLLDTPSGEDIECAIADRLAYLAAEIGAKTVTPSSVSITSAGNNSVTVVALVEAYIPERYNDAEFPSIDDLPF